MSIKDKLIEVFDEVLFSEGFTYEEMIDRTGLTRSQLVNLKLHKGKSITVERLEKALENMDIYVLLEVVRI